MVKRGDTVRAPWHDMGDDPELTGTVVSVTKKQIRVIWHDNGTVTPSGDESCFTPEMAEKLETI